VIFSFTHFISCGKVESVKISCAEPYFVEDDIFRPLEELKAKRPLRLVVCLS